MGVIPAVIAAIVLVGRASGKIGKRRKEYFDAQVLPRLTAFLKNFSPAV